VRTGRYIGRSRLQRSEETGIISEHTDASGQLKAVTVFIASYFTLAKVGIRLF
jgi:hypothetical protein